MKIEVNGTIYTAAIHSGGFESMQILDRHFAGLNTIDSGEPYITYVGGGWSKAGFNSFEEWNQFVKSEKEKISRPLKIQIQ